MYTEARKIHLIEEVLKINNDVVLIELETVLNNYKKTEIKSNIYDFVGIISKKEAKEMKQAITDSCEKISC